MSEVKTQFQILLERFNELVKDNQPLTKKVKDELEEIKLAATVKNEFTGRQAQAIIDRCNHYLNGTYGTKKDIQLK